MFLETLGGDFRNFLRCVLLTLSKTLDYNVFVARKDALEEDVIRSLFAIEIENLALDSVLGLLILFVR